MMKCVRLARKVPAVETDLQDAMVPVVVTGLRDAMVPVEAMVLRDVARVLTVAVQWGHQTLSDLLNTLCILMLMEMENSIRQN